VIVMKEIKKTPVMYGNPDSHIDRICKVLALPLTPQDDFTAEDVPKSDEPIVMFGVCPQKMGIIRECWRVGRQFYTIDSGYLGNVRAPFHKFRNGGYKKWFRLVPNDIQHCGAIQYDHDDRIERLGVSPIQFGRGDKILVALPGHIACTYHDIDIDTLPEEITQEIRKYSGREIEFRGFPSGGTRERFRENQFWKRLKVGDIHCTVSWGSVAAVESTLCGIPTISLRPCITSPVCSSIISDIENIEILKEDRMQDWLRGISKVCITSDELHDQIRALK